MKAHEAEKLIETIRSFVEHGAAAQTAVAKATAARLTPDVPSKGNGEATTHAAPPDTDRDVEKLYLYFKRRLIDEAKVDPILVRLLTVQPEILVDIERKVVTLDGGTLKGRCARLIAGGWFETPKETGATRRELARLGSDPSGNNNLANALSALRNDGFLTSESGGWRIAPGIKVTAKTLETEGS